MWFCEKEGFDLELGHYWGPVVPWHEYEKYEDADVMRVLERLALRRRVQEEDEA